MEVCIFAMYRTWYAQDMTTVFRVSNLTFKISRFSFLWLLLVALWRCGGSLRIYYYIYFYFSVLGILWLPLLLTLVPSVL